MSDYEREYAGLHWRRDEVNVRKFSASSGAKASTVRIELEVKDSFALGQLLHSLQDAQRPPTPKPAERAARLALGAPVGRLPAPLLQLTDGRRK